MENEGLVEFRQTIWVGSQEFQGKQGRKCGKSWIDTYAGFLNTEKVEKKCALVGYDPRPPQYVSGAIPTTLLVVLFSPPPSRVCMLRYFIFCAWGRKPAQVRLLWVKGMFFLMPGLRLGRVQLDDSGRRASHSHLVKVCHHECQIRDPPYACSESEWPIRGSWN